jgi:anthranilate phosphoribosyltransferase
MCGGPRDAVLANAAAALYAGGAAASLQDAMRAARESLDSGRAARVLDHLIAFTRSLPAMA